jgi:hypothetical protein
MKKGQNHPGCAHTYLPSNWNSKVRMQNIDTPYECSADNPLSKIENQ